MRITFLVFFIASVWIGSITAASLWTFLPDISIYSTSVTDYYAKIETYSYNDTQAATPTFYVCILTLTTQAQGGSVFTQKRRYVVGETGTNGPDIIPLPYQFDNSKIYKDIDLVSGPADCLFAVLSTDNVVYIGNGESAYSPVTLSNNRDQIELVNDGAVDSYFFTMNSFWYLPPQKFGSPNLFSFGDSQDAILLANGDIAAVGAASGSSTLSVRTASGADTAMLNQAGYGGNKPSLVGWSDSTFMACAQNVNKGIVCGSYPSGPDSVVARAATATQSVTYPILSLMDKNSDLASMACLMYDNSFAQSYYEVSVVNKNSVIQLSVSKGGVYLVSQTAQANYIFAVYYKSTGLYMDVIYYGDSQPPLPPPVAVPVTPPVTAPVAAPITPPTTSPIIDTPLTAPQADVPAATTPTQNTPSTVDVPVAGPIASNGTLGPASAVGADVLGPAIAIPGAAVVGTGLFLLLFFLKKKKKEKDEKDEEQSSDDGTATPRTVINGSNQRFSVDPSNYGNIPGRASVTGYGAIPDGGAPTGPDTFQGINPTAIKPSEVDKRMQIPYKSLFFAREIGAGSYGKVFQGEWRGAQVAIKVNNQISDTDGFLAEAKLTLGIAPHPNLVQTFGVSLDGPNPCIVLEFCGGGSLDGVMYDKDLVVTNEKKRDYALKIAYGLIHLHNNNIVHRDLAARNILLANDGTPKISDFGMSRVIQDEGSKGKTKATIGPLRWMAPESLQDRDYSVKSDVWSYGILVWEIVARREPHEDEDQLMIGAKIRDLAYAPQIPADCDPTLKQVMEMCWKKDPNERPTLDQIIDLLRSA